VESNGGGKVEGEPSKRWSARRKSEVALRLLRVVTDRTNVSVR